MRNEIKEFFGRVFDYVCDKIAMHIRERKCRLALRTLFETKGEDDGALRFMIEHALGRRLREPQFPVTFDIFRGGRKKASNE